MKLLWTNTTSKTKENLDKLLHTFCNSYEKFEQESIPSLAVRFLALIFYLTSLNCSDDTFYHFNTAVKLYVRPYFSKNS